MKTNIQSSEITVHGKIPAGFTDQKIKNLITKILRLANLSAVGIGVAFVGPLKMSAYNKLYRKKNQPTDVLSFAYHKSKQPAQNIEGDIIICPAFVRSDIKGGDILFGEQLKRLLVHGILHLSGLDHVKDAQAKKMFLKQEKILKAL